MKTQMTGPSPEVLIRRVCGRGPGTCTSEGFAGHADVGLGPTLGEPPDGGIWEC